MTGPQGSGNHLFSKALGLNPNLWVWPSLQEKYWEGHDMEPFAEYWKHPQKLNEFDWTQSKHFITSVSCPYFDNGVETIPDYHEFVKFAQEYANIKFLVIGRDQNILEHQQIRVRGRHTTPLFLEQLDDIVCHYDIVFASQEMLYLYGIDYLQQIEFNLGLTRQEISNSKNALSVVLQKDANAKYISQTESDLDEMIKLASSKKGAV